MDINTTLLIIASFITAIATCLVARHAQATLRVSEEMKRQSEDMRREYKTLLLYLTASSNMTSKFAESPSEAVGKLKVHIEALRSVFDTDNS